jgi:dihydrofolate reductase
MSSARTDRCTAVNPRAKEHPMSKVFTGASMSLDGYVSGPDESGFEHLFKWYGAGDVAVPTADPEMTPRMTPESAEYFRTVMDKTGAIVVGRKLFDYTNGWDGNHPLGVPVVVLTHSVPDGWPREDAPFTFVSEGIERAVEVAKELAGDKVVGLNSGMIASQALNAGLVDELWVDLVPVLLGAGTPFFSGLADAPIELEGPLAVVDAPHVTHLRYRVAGR